jgi:hypothetical protein
MARAPEDGKNADKNPAVSARDRRLKAALRENLRRRKAQARGRDQAQSAAETPPEGAPPRENGE